MGFAELLEKRFLGKEICVSINNSETETLVLDQFWTQNREYFQGVVEEIFENIIVLKISSEYLLYLNPDDISYIWEPGFNINKVFRSPSHRK